EQPQALDDLAHALGAVARVADRSAGLRVLVAELAAGRAARCLERLRRGLEVSSDVGERVIDLVGDAGGEGPQARHAIGDQEPLAHALALGDVAPAGDHGVRAADLDEDARYFADPEAAVRAADPDLDDLGGLPGCALADPREQLLDLGAVVGMDEL